MSPKMPSINNISTQYDFVAEEYDELFLDENSIVENKNVAKMLIPYTTGSIFEIGCGTGLLLDLISIMPNDYFGCEPSKGMLNVFKKKHPDFISRVENTTFEQSKEWKKYETIISIFGPVSYLDETSLQLIADSKCRMFLMFYKPDYTPITYIKTNVSFFHYKYKREQLELLFNNCFVTEFNNFLIVSTT